MARRPLHRQATIAGGAAALLNDVRQFVSDQLLTSVAVGVVVAAPEEQVSHGGERLCLQRAVQMVCLAIRMHSDTAEIRTEGLLHPCAQWIRQWLPTRPRALDATLDTRPGAGHRADAAALHARFFLILLLRHLLPLDER